MSAPVLPLVEAAARWPERGALIGLDLGTKTSGLAVCDPDSLEPLSVVAAHAVLLGAIRIGSIRLIDNLLVKMPGGKSGATR